MMAFEEIVGLRKGVCYQIGLFLYRKKSKITEFWNCASRQPVDINSIKYEVNERKWKNVIVELTNPTKFKINITVDITGTKFDGKYMNFKDNAASSDLNPGETKFLKISLRDYNPEDIDTIRLQHAYSLYSSRK